MQRKPEQGPPTPTARHLIPDTEKITEYTDLAWIEENLLLFRSIVLDHYLAFGRGVLVVLIEQNRAFEPTSDVWYLAEDQLKNLTEPEVQELVCLYNPHTEMVVVLIDETSTQRPYRLKLPPQVPDVV